MRFSVNRIEISLLLVLLVVVSKTSDVYAQTKLPAPPLLSEVPKKDSADKEIDAIEWGEWNKKTDSPPKYGVGIVGTIESELSQLDKSDLLNNATGVATTKLNNQKDTKQLTKAKDIKNMMKELEAIEAELKKELSDDTEF